MTYRIYDSYCKGNAPVPGYWIRRPKCMPADCSNKYRLRYEHAFCQPHSQGISSYRPLERARRDPGWVWSRATLKIENIRKGSSVIRQFVALSFVRLRPPLPAMFNSSLWGESWNGIYSTVYVKVWQVCLETIYHGRDVVAVVPIGFMESRSYFNCGRWTVHDSY